MAPKKDQAPEEPPGPQPHDVPAGGLDVPPAEKLRPQGEDVKEAFPGEFQLLPEERNRWLILHFALPRTIMTCDMAEGRNTATELNEVLASMAWGNVDSASSAWILESEEPTMEPPHPTMISYSEFIERMFPTDKSMAEQPREENAQTATERRGAFTNPGEPGERFRPFFDQLVKNLAHSNKALMKAYDLKKPVLDEAEVPEDPTKSEAQNVMRFGRYQVLPAFWQLLVQLTKRQRRFSLVFRSFSEEQVSVVQRELGLFCQGQHPAYDGKNKTVKPAPMTGDKGSRDMRLVSQGLGRMSRFEGRLEFPDRPAGDAPKIARPGELAGAAAPPAEGGAEPAAPAEGSTEDAEGSAPAAFKPTVYNFVEDYAEVYGGLEHQVLDGVNTAAIIDDRGYWKDQDRDSKAGKLLLVDHGGGLAETKVQHIFFDGSVRKDDAYCVDVREVRTGEPISRTEADGLFLHQVDLFQASLEPDYFVRAVDACELKFSQRILESRRTKADAAEEEAAAASKAAEEAQKLPPKEYLYKNVIPALLPALEACQRDRPADPIEFLGFYMLRHSKQYSKSLKG